MDFVFNLPLIVVGPCIIVLLIAFAVGGLALFRRSQLPKLRFGHSDAHFSGAILASIMVFYGLALALTAVHVWETYEDVSKITSREAALIASLWRDVSEYPEPIKSLLQAGLKDYVDYTIHEAWPLQKRGIVPARGIQRIEVRRMRLDAVEIRLPAVMWIVVLAGAAISLVSSFFFPVEDFRVHAIQVGLLAVLIGVVIFMIVAFDRPFRRELGLTAAPYELVYDQLMRHF
jgi:hypothetical protein